MRPIRYLAAADVDGDGDTDVLGAAMFGNAAWWWENVDAAGPGTGDGTSWSGWAVLDPYPGANRLDAADMDGDGDLDFLASSRPGDLLWVPNGDVAAPSGDPVADAGGPHSIDEGGSVSLDGSGSTDTGTIVQWAWDCDGDGSYELVGSSATGLTCSFVDDGSFTVGLQVTDDEANTDTDTAPVTVANLPPTISSSAPTAASEGSPWSYVPAAADPGVVDVLAWSLDSGAPAAMGVDGATGALDWTPDYADVGSITVTLTVDDGDGGQDEETFTITVSFADADGDGMPDTWEGLVGLDPSIDDSAGDPDADGISNLDEWLGGTDPFSFDGPGPPVPTSPIGGQEVGTTTPSLAWDQAVDPGGDPLTYDVEVHLDVSLGALHTSVSGLSLATWIVDLALPDNATAWWRVRAADPHVASTWTDLQLFFVNTANDPPEVPGPLEPIGDVWLDVQSPTLRWSEPLDVDGDALTYDIEVSGGAELVASASDLAAAEWTTDVALAEDGAFAWRVRAVDEHGADSGWSAEQSFRISTANGAPTPVTWLVPSDGAEIEAVSPDLELSPSSDPEGDAILFVVELAPGPDFADPIALSGATPGFSLASEGLALEENRTWSARARAEDDGGAVSDWATVSWFVRGANDPPAVPALVAPADQGELGVLVAGHALDPEGDAVSYEFVVARDAGLADVLASSGAIEPGAGPEGTADQSSWAPEVDEVGTLYWSARAVDDRDAASDWAEARGARLEAPSVAADCACSSVDPAGGGPGLLVALLGLVGWLRRRPVLRARLTRT